MQRAALVLLALFVTACSAADFDTRELPLTHHSLSGCVAAYADLDTSLCRLAGPLAEFGAVGCDNGSYLVVEGDGRDAYVKGEWFARFVAIEHGVFTATFADGGEGTCDVLAGVLTIGR